MSEEYGDMDESLEDNTSANNNNNNSANNSIIGKMKSSVTSILPNSFSKWFSPVSNNNNTESVSIKRSRAEIETERHTTQARTFAGSSGTSRNMESVRRRVDTKIFPSKDEDEDFEDEDDDDNPRDCNYINITTELRQRRLNTSLEEGQPPSKRLRETLDSSMLTSRPLISSTPAIASQRSTGIADQQNHYGHLNLYAGSKKKDPAYNFPSTVVGSNNFGQHHATDIIDLIPIPMSSRGIDTSITTKTDQIARTDAPRQIRTLNIPPSIASTSSTYASSGLPTLKRQSLSSIKGAMNADGDEPPEQKKSLNENDICENVVCDDAFTTQSYNGQIQSKFHNGAGEFEEDLRHRSTTDSEAEDNDTISELPGSAVKTNIPPQRGTSTGLFNMSANNSRNGSRTSSFGNGLNFFSHLEGRKSLFSSNNQGSRPSVGNALNSSTLSLNSLSRRQFNASIYGSTSALSDSRLLNTSSPFYKGNTTYGGAAAYSKYTTNIGSSSRLTPTLIRPTSSLSTLSSSSNSLAAGTGVANLHGENTPAISGTAKTILDIINGFITPLGEAKKMASSLRQQSNFSTVANAQPSKSKRFSESDLHASRAVRLQQVRTPYTRPIVMLQPKKSSNEGQLPPVRELQVPSMSQLLQMKKLQDSTERSRQLTMQNSTNHEYTIATSQQKQITKSIPIQTTQISQEQYMLSSSISTENVIEKNTEASSDSKQQKHVNKIKHKVANPLRQTDFSENEPPPSPPKLPSIEFPVMKEMPKIDITLPTLTSRKKNIQGPITTQSSDMSPSISVSFANNNNLKDGYKFSPPDSFKNCPPSVQGIAPSMVNFTFTEPESVTAYSSTKSTTKQSPQFGSNSLVTGVPSTLPQTKNVMAASSTLKSGSVLDALKTPLKLPENTSAAVGTITPTTTWSSSGSFGNQFKKSVGEWDCDTCMVRNKENAQKCVSCETPKKGEGDSKKPLQGSTSSATALPAISFGFGNQFQKQAGEWECDACMVRNKSDATKCVSCETLRSAKLSAGNSKPAHSQTSTLFSQNNLLTATKDPIATSVISSDSGFKSIAAAQKASKWECDACMTQNDALRSKCICCEQAKPGNDNTKENSSTFNFGTTAASKFTFGFGAGSAAKESELRQKEDETLQQPTKTTTNDEKTEKGSIVNAPKGYTFGAGLSNSATTGSGFSFGFPAKPALSTASTTVPTITPTPGNKDTTDNKTKSNAFTFGIQNTTTTSSSGTTPNSSAIAVTGDFKLNTQATSTTATSLPSVSPSVKFTLPTSTTDKIAPTSSSSSSLFTTPKAPPAFSFGSTSNKITTTNTALGKPQGFSFGLTPQKSSGEQTSSQPAATSSTTTTATTGFPSNASSLFAFSTTSATTISNTVTSTTTTTISAQPFSFGLSSTTTSANSSATTKPIFSFGSSSVPSTVTSTSSLSTTSKPIVTSVAAAVAPSFSFGNMSQAPASASAAIAPVTTAIKPIFGSVVSSSTTPSTTTTTFGSFGSPKNASTTASSSATTFGGFTFGAAAATTPAKAESGNLFGSFACKPQAELKPTASATPIFGSASAVTTTEANTSSNWQKNTFLFGSQANVSTSGINNNNNNNNNSIGSATASGETPAKSMFGSFKPDSDKLASNTASTAASNTNQSLLFGNVGASASAPNFANNNAGGSAAVFGSSSTTSNLFGSNKNTSVPQFGTAIVSSNPTNATPLFGSSLSNTTPATFGSFGSAAATTVMPNSTTGNEVNTQPVAAAAPFSFGAPQSQSSSGGFNFGATAAAPKPAFNFTSTNQQRTFNFTGSTTETAQNSAKPFQFGATAAPSFNATPSFSFGGTSAPETTGNTPFQFNAGANPAASNIFAPAPTPTTGNQTATRRKVRVPMRRITPR